MDSSPADAFRPDAGYAAKTQFRRLRCQHVVWFGIYNCQRLHDSAGRVHDGCYVSNAIPCMGKRKGEIPGGIHVRYAMDGTVRISVSGRLSILSAEITAVLFRTYASDEVDKIATALQWLSWAGGLNFLTTAVLAVLRATDKRRAFSVLMGTTAFLNISLNLYLIPRFSHVGAAIAMVISEAYVLVVGIGYISRNIVKFRETFLILPTLLKVVFLSTIMGIGLVLLKGFLSVWVLIPLAVLFYGGGIAVLGEFRSRFRFD